MCMKSIGWVEIFIAFLDAGVELAPYGSPSTLARVNERSESRLCLLDHYTAKARDAKCHGTDVAKALVERICLPTYKSMSNAARETKAKSS